MFWKVNESGEFVILNPNTKVVAAPDDTWIRVPFLLNLRSEATQYQEWILMDWANDINGPKPGVARYILIIVNMGKMKEVVSYTLEVSRDTFNTIEHLIETDTSFVVVNKQLIGEQLFWNTLYQVRATAKAKNEVYNSRPADLGSVRTQRFPTILNIPAIHDVIDVAARVTWVQAGAPVTGAKVFSADDLQLNTPLFDEKFVSPEENAKGEFIVTGLEPATAYQIAIFRGEDLRGWVNYTTLEADIDPSAPGVIDVRQNESASAVTDAVSMASDGSIIPVKKK